MTRSRKKDRHLPRCVYHQHGAYFLVKDKRWIRLGSTLHEALAAYAVQYEGLTGDMPKLIDAALVDIKPRVAKSSGKQYDTAGRTLKRKLAQFSPAQVKPKHIAAIKVSMAGTPNMANRCLSLLRQVFDFALEHQVEGVDSNPAIGIKRYTERKRDRLVTLEEFQAIHAKAGPRLQLILGLHIRTGQRIQDVLNIQRADLTDEGIKFRQQKTKAKVVVPWTPELQRLVEQAKAMFGSSVSMLSTKRPLLRNRNGKAPDYRTVHTQFVKACRAAGIEDTRPNDMRAMAATWAKRQGLDATALLGHTSPAQTVRYLRDRESKVAEGPSFDDLSRQSN